MKYSAAFSTPPFCFAAFHLSRVGALFREMASEWKLQEGSWVALDGVLSIPHFKYHGSKRVLYTPYETLFDAL